MGVTDDVEKCTSDGIVNTHCHHSQCQIWSL